MIHPPVFLEQHYSRLIGPERRAHLTAETYRYEVRRFLVRLTETAGTLETAAIRGLSRYLEQRRIQDRIGSRSVSKACAVLGSFFQFAVDESRRLYMPEATGISE